MPSSAQSAAFGWAEAIQVWLELSVILAATTTGIHHGANHCQLVLELIHNVKLSRKQSAINGVLRLGMEVELEDCELSIILGGEAWFGPDGVIREKGRLEALGIDSECHVSSHTVAGFYGYQHRG